MAVSCPGDGGTKPCPTGDAVRFVVKHSAAPGWRGRFCAACLTSWLRAEMDLTSKSSRITIETLW